MSTTTSRSTSEKAWAKFFLSAALFNYVIGFPIWFARGWAFDLTFLSSVARDPMAVKLWGDFGFGVVLIGIGYHIVSRDVSKNRGIVYLGVAAKLFDVVNLTYLYWAGMAAPLVLIPAGIDGAYAAGFVLFLLRTARTR